MTSARVERFRRAARRCFEQRQEQQRELARSHQKGLLEALIFAAAEPLGLRELARAAKVKRPVAEELLGELCHEYRDRGVELSEVAGGFVFRTHVRYGAAVRDLVAKKPVRMTRAQLETLAVVSYRQPVTRPEIDDIRGVDSGPVLRTLLERDVIRILGKKEEPGRPLLYGTTDKFLKLFGLDGLSQLPTLREFTELSEDSRAVYERHVGDEAPDGELDLDADRSSSPEAEPAEQSPPSAEPPESDVGKRPAEEPSEDEGEGELDDEDEDGDEDSDDDAG